MKTAKGQILVMETIDTTVRTMRTLPMCTGEIPGASPYHITIPAGEVYRLPTDTAHYNIFILVEGQCGMESDGTHADFAERVTFVPAPEAEMTLTAVTDVQLVRIAWDITGIDVALRAEYGTKFPLIVPYATAIQYVDPNKSPKTISRMMIPHKMIPRFAIGSVESYGYDYVKPHSHPMLDQFFFSFPENKMNLIINGEFIPMGGNEIVHIPLGAEHGVEVTGIDHLHYMWIDFLPDNDAGIKRLDERHKPTGTMRDLEKEDKYRNNDK